jgi:dUTP pyrophosphatase
MKIQMKVLDKEFYKVEKLGGSYYDTPFYATSGSAGLDLKATKNYTIAKDVNVDIPTGIAVWLGHGSDQLEWRCGVGYAATKLFGLLIPRSSTGKRGLQLVNTVGVIDSDYQGELIISVVNRSDTPLTISAGDRIAQLVVLEYQQPRIEVVEEFSNNTHRGAGGFGSSGK